MRPGAGGPEPGGRECGREPASVQDVRNGAGDLRDGSLIDVLIQTFNEELNLPHTLRSVQGWAHRIFVVDSGSTDQTVRIAERHGAVVVSHAWEGYAQQK